MTRRGPISLTLDPPSPVQGSGPCRADKLFDLGGFCGDRATRQVTVGLGPVVHVCTWHSLCATGQLDAYLVRQRTRRSP
jgi:hypothetical protein